MSRLATVRNNLGDLITGRTLAPDPDPRLDALLGSAEPLIQSPYSSFYHAFASPETRLKEMEFYDWLETNIADVKKALDAYATMAVTGNLAGAGNRTYTIKLLDEESKYPKELVDRLVVNQRAIAAIAYQTVRAMTKYGNYAPEIVPGVREDGRMGVQFVNAKPPGTMYRNVGTRGEVDPKRYWYQKINGQVVGGPDQDPNGLYKNAIEQWRVPNFALWSNMVTASEILLYGQSILQPFGPIGIKMLSMIDAMVIARLTRAAMRYVWHIDVSDIKNEPSRIMARVNKWAEAHSRKRNLLDQQGTEDSYKRPMVPDQDFYIPAGKDFKWDVRTLDGDTNLANVGDLGMLAQFYFGALGVPAAYLGHSDAAGGRSNLTQVDINFARSVRHIQMFAAAGFNHIIWVDMILGGWDPREYPVECIPPNIGARDDLLHAQIMVLKSTVVANLAAAGLRLDVEPRWILETFLDMDEELSQLSDDKIAKLFEKLPEEAGGGAGGAPKDRSGARVNEAIRNALSRVNGDLLKVIRDNVLTIADDEAAKPIYAMNNPSIEQLASQLGR